MHWFDPGWCICGFYSNLCFLSIIAMHVTLFHQLAKIINNSRLIQFNPNIFPHDCMDVYYFLMWFSLFLYFWNFIWWLFVCTWCYIDMLNSFACEMHIVYPIGLKFDMLVPNMWLDFWELVWHFYLVLPLFWIHGHLVWQFVSQFVCCICTFSFICHLISSGVEFLYDVHS